MKRMPQSLWARFMGASLQNKLVFLILPVVITPLMLLGAFSYYQSSQLVENQVIRTILENLSQVNNSLNYFVKDIEQLTMYMYRNEELQSVLAKPAGRPLAEKYEDRKRVDDLLDSFLGFKNWDINIYVLGSNGDRYFTGDLLPANYDDYNVNWGHFRRMRLADGNVVWDTHYSIKKIDDYGIVLSSGRMLKDFQSDETLGYLVVDIMESALADKYNKASLAPGGELFLIDRDGYIVSSRPSKQQVGIKLAEPYLNQVLNGKQGFFLGSNANGRKVAVVYDTSEITGFKLISAVPIAVLTEESGSIRDLTLWIAGIGLVLSLFFIYLLSVHITSPLRKLKSLMNKVEIGMLDVSFASKYEDEVGQLGRSFNTMVQRIKQLIDEVYRKQLMVQEAEIKAIQAQFNPHFLYNALDTINWMARIHKLNDISRTVVSLGELLRFSIRKGPPYISVYEDMQQIRNYLTIIKMRFGDQIDVEIDIEPEIEPLYTLKLLIQPLVENAVTHGVEMKVGTGHVRIEGRRVEDRIRFCVCDDGNGMPDAVLEGLRRGHYKQTDPGKTGIGLENIQRRLQLYFPEEHDFQIESRLGKGTTVIIHIPIMTTPREA